MTSKSKEVDDWFKSLDHPQKKTMQALRDAILNADPRMSECIKWKTATFVFNGNLASINPAAKKFTSLMFHRGGGNSGKTSFAGRRRQACQNHEICEP